MGRMGKSRIGKLFMELEIEEKLNAFICKRHRLWRALGPLRQPELLPRPPNCAYSSSGALYRAKEKPRWIALENNDQLKLWL